MTTDRMRPPAIITAAVTTCALGMTLGTYAGAVVGATALAALVLSTALLVASGRRATAHVIAARALRRRTRPVRLAGTAARTGISDRSAFVAGLLRPTIYCDTALAERLTEGELSAVLLHERGHQRAHDPLRLTLLATVAPVLRRSGAGCRLLATIEAGREIAADRFAITHGATRQDLASALLTVTPTAAAGSAGFSSAAELRLRALLDDPGVARRGLRARSVVLGAFVGGITCALVMHPLLYGGGHL